MSFKEVTQLRKSGQLNEALAMAEEDLLIDPVNEWNKRAIVWVYYAFLKSAQEGNQKEAFFTQLNNIINLDLPETETYVFNSLAWSIGKFLFHFHSVNHQMLNELFDLITDLHFTKPDDAYSFLLKAFKKQAGEWNRFQEFITWWGLKNFQPKDYENFILDNGKKIPSLVESIYISRAKTLLNEPVDKEAVKRFIPEIANLSKQHKNMQYPPYYYAKLLLAMGDKEHFLEAFLPFAKKKNRDFWVWNLMSENFDKSSNEYYSCLCKAASCGAPDKFTGDVREKLADVFISKKMFKEAKFELSKIIDSRQKEGWALRDKHIGWQNLSWWNTTKQTKKNFKIYNNNLSLAESLLYTDMPEEITIVERVNKEKSVLNFVVSKSKYGFFNYSKFKITPKVGDIYTVRFEKRKDETSNFYRIKSIAKTSIMPDKEIHKIVNGNLIINQGNSFGFINNDFVSPQIISKYKLQNGNYIKGAALQTYNSKRKAWGWNIFNIEK